MIRFSDAVIAFSLFAANLLAVLRYFLTDFSAQVWNNDYLYIAIARMFRDRPWTWNSLQYGGAPFPYVYPPLFHLLVNATPVDSLGRAYHAVAAIGYALVPVALYILGRQLFRSRLAAAFGACAYGFLPSPVYYVLPVWKGIAAGYYGAPWGFVALVGYSEAAHTLAFAVALLAAAAAWRDRWTPAAVLGAAVFLLNWAGIVGFLMILAAVAAARWRDLGLRHSALRAISVAGIAYGLAAFWMTPGFFRATQFLNRVVLRHEQPSEPWNAYTWLILGCAAALVALSLWRKIPAAASFVLALAALAGVAPAALSGAGNYLVPLPHRYVLELNAALVLGIGWLLSAAGRWRPALAGVMAVFGLIASSGFLRHAWDAQPRSVDPRTLPAWRISQWLADHARDSRVLVSGELEGALALWTDIPQVGGIHQGTSNFLMPAAQREVSFGCRSSGETARLWARALAVRYVVVHGPRSPENFHWWARTDRFAYLPVAWSEGGDTIYEITEERQAVVVDVAQLGRVGRMQSTADEAFLRRYTDWAHGKRAAAIRWSGPDRAEIEENFAPGEALLIKSNYDRGWKAAGSTEPDPIGFLLIRPAPGSRKIELPYGAAWDVWVGRGITLFTLVSLLASALMTAPFGRGSVRGSEARPKGAVIDWIGISPLAAGILAFGILALHTPPEVPLADEAYRRLQPPLINPGGIVDSAVGPPPIARGSVFTIYGQNFGSPQSQVAVSVAGGQAEILYHGTNQLNVKMPESAPASADVHVWVDGCTGNGFTVLTK